LQAELPQPDVAWGSHGAPQGILFPQMLGQATLAVKNTSSDSKQIQNQSRNTAKETSIASVSGKNKAQVHLLKK